MSAGAAYKCLRSAEEGAAAAGGGHSDELRWVALGDRLLVPLADALLVHVTRQGCGTESPDYSHHHYDYMVVHNKNVTVFLIDNYSESMKSINVDLVHAIICRLLSICTHVLEEQVPGPPASKPSLPSLPNAPSLSPIKRKAKGIDAMSPGGQPGTGEKGSGRTPSKG